MDRYRSDTCHEELEESKAFFYSKLDFLRKKIEEYQQIIQIIEGLPVLSNHKYEVEQKRKETLLLTEKMFSNLYSSKI